MRITLDSGSANPNYLQIENSVKSQILRGEIHPGDQLPSIRQLARDLQIAIITVKRAYDDLEQEGIVETRQGKGCFVRQLDVSQLNQQSWQQIQEESRLLIRKARHQNLDPEQIKTIFLAVLKEETEKEESESHAGTCGGDRKSDRQIQSI